MRNVNNQNPFDSSSSEADTEAYIEPEEIKEPRSENTIIFKPINSQINKLYLEQLRKLWKEGFEALFVKETQRKDHVILILAANEKKTKYILASLCFRGNHEHPVIKNFRIRNRNSHLHIFIQRVLLDPFGNFFVISYSDGRNIFSSLSSNQLDISSYKYWRNKKISSVQRYLNEIILGTSTGELYISNIPYFTKTKNLNYSSPSEVFLFFKSTDSSEIRFIHLVDIENEPLKLIIVFAKPLKVIVCPLSREEKLIIQRKTFLERQTIVELPTKEEGEVSCFCTGNENRFAVLTVEGVYFFLLGQDGSFEVEQFSSVDLKGIRPKELLLSEFHFVVPGDQDMNVYQRYSGKTIAKKKFNKSMEVERKDTRSGVLEQFDGNKYFNLLRRRATEVSNTDSVTSSDAQVPMRTLREKMLNADVFREKDNSGQFIFCISISSSLDRYVFKLVNEDRYIWRSLLEDGVQRDEQSFFELSLLKAKAEEDESEIFEAFGMFHFRHESFEAACECFTKSNMSIEKVVHLFSSTGQISCIVKFFKVLFFKVLYQEGSEKDLFDLFSNVVSWSLKEESEVALLPNFFVQARVVLRNEEMVTKTILEIHEVPLADVRNELLLKVYELTNNFESAIDIYLETSRYGALLLWLLSKEAKRSVKPGFIQKLYEISPLLAMDDESLQLLEVWKKFNLADFDLLSPCIAIYFQSAFLNKEKFLTIFSFIEDLIFFSTEFGHNLSIQQKSSWQMYFFSELLIFMGSSTYQLEALELLRNHVLRSEFDIFNKDGETTEHAFVRLRSLLDATDIPGNKAYVINSLLTARFGNVEEGVRLCLEHQDYKTSIELLNINSQESINKSLWMLLTKKVVTSRLEDEEKCRCLIDVIDESKGMVTLVDVLDALPDEEATPKVLEFALAEAGKRYAELEAKNTLTTALSEEMHSLRGSISNMQKQSVNIADIDSMVCTLCSRPFVSGATAGDPRNKNLVFPCGDTFHLSCLVEEVSKLVDEESFNQIKAYNDILLDRNQGQAPTIVTDEEGLMLREHALDMLVGLVGKSCPFCGYIKLRSVVNFRTILKDKNEKTWKF
eukprot:snap_masked-scaffold_14-processed-gene-5.45-mRNA-1 protein AED:1.00 eAED:1.00 QI:0/-1/0/0/-1/1/1/0/1071